MSARDKPNPSASDADAQEDAALHGRAPSPSPPSPSSSSPPAASTRTSSTTGRRPICSKAGDKAYGATIRLGGMVAPGSIKNRTGVSGVEFDVKDATRHRPREVQRRAAADVPREHRRRRRRDDGARRLLPVQPPHGLAQQRVPRAEGRAPDRQGRAGEADRSTDGGLDRRPMTATLGRLLILASLLVVDDRRRARLRRRRASARRTGSSGRAASRTLSPR